MTPAESLDNRLATIAFLIDTAVVPDAGPIYSVAEMSDYVLSVWCQTFLKGPAWNR